MISPIEAALTKMSPEERTRIAELLGVLGGQEQNYKFLPNSGNRQLQDLRIAPSESDPRPLFVPSAQLKPGQEPPLSAHKPFPSLRFHPTTGEEIRCETQKKQDEAEAKGYVRYEQCAAVAAVKPVEIAAATLAKLTEDERKQVMRELRSRKMQKAEELLAGLSDTDVTSAQQSAELRVRQEQNRSVTR